MSAPRYRRKKERVSANSTMLSMASDPHSAINCYYVATEVINRWTALNFAGAFKRSRNQTVLSLLIRSTSPAKMCKRTAQYCYPALRLEFPDDEATHVAPDQQRPPQTHY